MGLKTLDHKTDISTFIDNWEKERQVSTLADRLVGRQANETTKKGIIQLD